MGPLRYPAAVLSYVPGGDPGLWDGSGSDTLIGRTPICASVRLEEVLLPPPHPKTKALLALVSDRSVAETFPSSWSERRPIGP